MGSGGVGRGRLILGILGFILVTWLMLTAISANRLHRQAKKTVMVVPLRVNAMSKQLKLVSMMKRHSKSEMIFVSKRRVPNGPDPIHNRRAVKYRQPPTQA
ncbi:hypothetical protein HN51_059951 [Arachis hypogaea]|uniref:CLAVATA3/ESR (CLE)-related protein n=2 Tax=Arachis TaxID=3817 RepID=A0A445B3D5_ARAHY|nr:CLAVATA3/ESR (CLE)-related protein 25 [Arachis duranensis]XP_025624010.1 CLAVATA3/ESR (CLE)-related protein 25 [Arachis hypogaea]XP_025680372.1 CLAVATA3/ESR (CLE)-related protein 25 [Arachis hypogaea]XP_057736848.1 CLAVATA3/ESR (CLE)-related protein 25 [Arachis stenosperma]QHN83474.1 CLAVATA3/ESR (CLE)-related protein [Arachis hypogaea]QHO17087.1 CLAVATA3/ESR (CLE)-related protein [Arachis hypogaea]RYQ85788.1 hypothetical protein Ahy_B10g105396 [Arachis hypogaea]RYR33205.1 hypothetical pr